MVTDRLIEGFGLFWLLVAAGGYARQRTRAPRSRNSRTKE
jgi:hypothetical protein